MSALDLETVERNLREFRACSRYEDAYSEVAEEAYTDALALIAELREAREELAKALVAERRVAAGFDEVLRKYRAAAAEREALRTALEEAMHWMGDPEDPTGNADAAADRFYRATGVMAPFKDQAQAMGGGDEQERRESWSAWTKQERKRVWALVTAALRGES